MALMAIVRDAEDGDLLFAVVSDDEGADYLFPDDVEAYLDGERVEELAALMQTPPTDEAGWMELATYNLGVGSSVETAQPFESVDEAVDAAEKMFETYEVSAPGSGLVESGAQAFSQIAQDYPDFISADGEEIDPEAMENFVLMMLGPIDPEGPNGWILRAIDGEPRPGDEDEFIHFPGSAPIQTEDSR